MIRLENFKHFQDAILKIYVLNFILTDPLMLSVFQNPKSCFKAEF